MVCENSGTSRTMETTETTTCYSQISQFYYGVWSELHTNPITSIQQAFDALMKLSFILTTLLVALASVSFFCIAILLPRITRLYQTRTMDKGCQELDNILRAGGFSSLFSDYKRIDIAVQFLIQAACEPQHKPETATDKDVVFILSYRLQHTNQTVFEYIISRQTVDRIAVTSRINVWLKHRLGHSYASFMPETETISTSKLIERIFKTLSADSILEVLIGGDCSKVGWLISLVKSGNVETLSKILKVIPVHIVEKLFLEKHSTNGDSILFTAISHNVDIAMIQLISSQLSSQKWADLLIRRNDNNDVPTVLHYAARSNRIDYLMMLVARDPFITMPTAIQLLDQNGETFIHNGVLTMPDVIFFIVFNSLNSNELGKLAVRESDMQNGSETLVHLLIQHHRHVVLRDLLARCSIYDQYTILITRYGESMSPIELAKGEECDSCMDLVALWKQLILAFIRGSTNEEGNDLTGLIITIEYNAWFKRMFWNHLLRPIV